MPRQVVRAALLGIGAWGRVLATAAAPSKTIRITHCLSRDATKRDAFAREFGLVASGDYDAVLGDHDIDAVVVALPNELHYPFARSAAEARKHVYLEKPIASALADGLRIADLERRYGVRICVGHCARLLAGNRVMGKAVADGEIGQLNRIDAVFANGRGLRLTPGDWRWYQASSPGGPLSQIAIHQFDVLRYLGGDVASVSATAARRSPVGAEVEDEWLVALRFASGALGSVAASWTSPGAYRVQVSGDRGLMAYEIDQSLWNVADDLHVGATLYRHALGKPPRERVQLEVPRGNMFREELEMFARAIIEGGECELSADNGCQALAIVDAAIESAASGGRHVAPAELVARARRATSISDAQIGGPGAPSGGM
ncbi:MAG TPA: Gfo/Idh/MocA family oxidoreductase [Casimicrobiaceae bacterium]|nr:Gfo/Idh/MocA family oxidoreductase [Casimicrobiaceae bacterium]